MRKIIALAAASVAIFNLGVATARAEVQFSAGLEISSTRDFVQPLDSYGSWVDVRSYGRCWHPGRVERDWRPYSDGHWEWTDCGWYWVSDEPWSWATYHYGSWVNDNQYGWVWIPATEWAPAWVNWRESDDYVGWAPCGPRGAVLAPSLFVFIDVGHFHDRFSPRTLIVNDTTIINRTTVINNIRREPRNFDGGAQRVVINEGPRNKRLRADQVTASPRPVRELISQTPAPENIKRVRSGPSAIERPVLTPDRAGATRGTDQQTTRRNDASRPAASSVDRNQRTPNNIPPPAVPSANQPTARSSDRNNREGLSGPAGAGTPSVGPNGDRIYKESAPVSPTRTPPTPTTPTGRDEKRLYRESPSSSSATTETRPVRPDASAPGARQAITEKNSSSRIEDKATVTPRPTPQTRPESERNNENLREKAQPTETTPREKPLPPTGRERGNERGANADGKVVPKELPPTERTPAPTPQEKDRGNEKGRDKEHP